MQQQSKVPRCGTAYYKVSFSGSEEVLLHVFTMNRLNCRIYIGWTSDYDIRPKLNVWAGSPNECWTFGQTLAKCCMLGWKWNVFYWWAHCAARNCRSQYQGCTQEGADGAKAPPEIPRKNYLLIQIRSILCFAVCTKKSVSQSFYNNRLYRLRCWTAEAGHKMRCRSRVIN